MFREKNNNKEIRFNWKPLFIIYSNHVVNVLKCKLYIKKFRNFNFDFFDIS